MPCARSRETGTGTCWREPIANSEPAGRRSAKLGDDVAALRVRDRLGVVEDQRDGLVHRGDRRRQANDVGDARSGRGRRAADHRLERLDAIQRGREIGEEDGGVVVASVRREPCDARLLVFGPLGEQGRLPVARRRDHGEHRAARRCDEPLDDRGPADDAGAKLRRVELGLVEREAGHRPTPEISSVVDPEPRGNLRHRRRDGIAVPLRRARYHLSG